MIVDDWSGRRRRSTPGFHIRWRRKRGTSKWYVYTFIADRPIGSLKDKVRALTKPGELRMAPGDPMVDVVTVDGAAYMINADSGERVAEFSAALVQRIVAAG